MNNSNFSVKQICILTFTGYYSPGYKGGGPIKTIKNLFDKAGKDISFKLITSDRDLGDAASYTSVKYGDWNTVGNAKVFYAQPTMSDNRHIIKILYERNYDIVYLNSFFSARFSIFPLVIAKILGRKIILGPRGEFSSGALSLRSLKKRIFIKLYKFLWLHRSTIFQASSEYEAEDIRKVLGAKVDIQVAEDIGTQEFTDFLPTKTSAILKVVFVSRISPMKNLLGALELLGNVCQPVLYHIYGPIEDHDYWAQCESVIAALPLNIQVEYKGELRPEQVVKTISAYDLFFMPTKGENYGHVIAEALCAGLPLLIANTTPWRNLHKHGIGWDLPLNDPDAFSAVIDQLALKTPSEHQQLREKVLGWAKVKLSQRGAIEDNIAMFNYAYKKK